MTVLGLRALYSRGVVSSTPGPLLFARLQLGLLRVVAEGKEVVRPWPWRVSFFPRLFSYFPLPRV